MNKLNNIERRKDKHNFLFNIVNNNIIIFTIFLIQYENEPSIQKALLGKKRHLENFRQPTSNNLDTNTFPSSDSNKKSFGVKKITKELTNLYNMERSICLSCVKTKNKKYPTNKIIPCIPFSNQS